MSTQAGTHLLINITTRQLYHYQRDKIVEVYPVAVGKFSTPTPTGHYQVINKIINPGGALGTRWMGLNIPYGNYGIHGTNNPDSIGKAVSNGCIRMYNHHIENLFPYVNIGTPVNIIKGNSNEGKRNCNKKIYTVQPGDTLWEIARRHNVSLDAIIIANQDLNPEEIYPGQKIIIPI